jgi:nucleotide-binding universal stress UspA family protein
MRFPYKKILCPIDFDDGSIHALEQAIEIARHFGAVIFLVHVVPLIVEAIPIPYEAYQESQKAAMAKLNEIAGQKLSGIEHRCIVYTGDVIGSILQAVEKFRPDLLVMATHGRTGLAGFVLGSVAGAVVRKASCPVMTIRREEAAAHAKSKS